MEVLIIKFVARPSTNRQIMETETKRELLEKSLAKPKIKTKTDWTHKTQITERSLPHLWRSALEMKRAKRAPKLMALLLAESTRILRLRIKN